MIRAYLLLLVLIYLPPVCRANTASALAVAASVTTVTVNAKGIASETHDLTTHLKRTMKKHGRELKKALVKGQK
jgi:hypothetical protein